MRHLPVKFAVIALALPCVLPAMAHAQAYPSRPITVIVPFAAGGPVDTDTRKYLPRLTELLGQSVVSDYKPGAGTSIGAGFVAKARPDGYTLLSDSSAFAVFPAFYNNLNFDPLKDLIPLTAMHDSMSVMMVPVSSPIKSFAEYLAYTRANPGKLNVGTSGVGDISDLSGRWLHTVAGTRVTFVPYKGNGPMMVDLLAGRVDASSASLVTAVPLIKSGKLRPLAVRGPRRVKALPDIPAINEHPGMEEFSITNWMGFFVTGGTPAPVVDKLSAAMIAITKMPAVIADLDSQGSAPVGNTPAQFRAFVTEEIVRWKKVVADAGIKTE
jgi:tripartite-type tricarboxylate transporter receptor subunit TctC